MNKIETNIRTKFTSVSSALSPKAIAKLERLLIMDLFKFVTPPVFVAKVATLLNVRRPVVSELRKEFVNDGYVLFSLKPFLFYCYKYAIRKRKAVVKVGRKFGVIGDDLRLVLHLTHRTIAEKMSTLRKYTALSYEKLRKYTGLIPRKVDSFAKNEIFKTMRFIFRNQHYALDVEDIKQDLIDKGLRNLLWTYPRIDSLLHAVNVVKRAITNNGINMLYYYTRDQRSVVRRDGEGNFYSNMIPLTTSTESVLETIACPTVSNPLDTVVTIEQHVSTGQVVNHFKSKKKQAVVIALMGMNNRKFSNWLMKKAKPTHRMENDDLYDTLARRSSMAQYFNYLSSFTGYPKDKVMRVGMEAAKLIQA